MCWQRDCLAYTPAILIPQHNLPRRCVLHQAIQDHLRALHALCYQLAQVLVLTQEGEVLPFESNT